MDFKRIDHNFYTLINRVILIVKPKSWITRTIGSDVTFFKRSKCIMDSHGDHHPPHVLKHHQGSRRSTVTQCTYKTPPQKTHASRKMSKRFFFLPQPSVIWKLWGWGLSRRNTHHMLIGCCPTPDIHAYILIRTWRCLSIISAPFALI